MFTATAMGRTSRRRSPSAVVLALFIPLIISSGGNSGLAGDVADHPRAGAARGASCATGGASRCASCRSGLALGAHPRRGRLRAHHALADFGWADYTTPTRTLVALTVGLALVGVVTFGSLTGSMLPFLLKRLGFDPASASAPFVATLVDVTGLIIYFTVALLVLRGTLL